MRLTRGRRKGRAVVALLELKNLNILFTTKRGVVRAVNGVSYAVEKGKTLGIVGESGSGKSVSAMSIIRLLEGNGKIAGGEILFEGKNLVQASEKEMRHIRGNRISVIFQEPMTSLNPVFTIKRQVAEPFRVHRKLRKKEAEREAVEMLRLVRIPNPETTARQYPHQLSGGMRQRVMIAMALACRPQLLIADEPTTALDVTIQAQILQLMNELKKEQGTSILFITHDFGVVKEMADEVAVMYCGQIVEQASVRQLFEKGAPKHPYTEALMRSAAGLSLAKGGRLPVIEGMVPHLSGLPAGCLFAPRCPYAAERCTQEEPFFFTVEPGHKIRCRRYAQEGGR